MWAGMIKQSRKSSAPNYRLIHWRWQTSYYSLQRVKAVELGIKLPCFLDVSVFCAQKVGQSDSLIEWMVKSITTDTDYPFSFPKGRQTFISTLPSSWWTCLASGPFCLGTEFSFEYVQICRWRSVLMLLSLPTGKSHHSTREEHRSVLEDDLKSRLNMDKTWIAHVNDSFIFLGQKIICKRSRSWRHMA